MAKQTKGKRQRTIENKKSRFDYQGVDELEVGMVLTGQEIKSIRAGHMQLAGSYGRLLQGPKQPELWLVGAQIANTNEKQRTIKLLAHRSEIDRLIGAVQQKGYTLVPDRVYVTRGRAKLSLKVAKGRREFEKRSKLREKDINRDIERVVRGK